MNRRNFIALASGLLVPWQPERVYSFLPAWRLLHQEWFFGWFASGSIVVLPEQCPDTTYNFGGIAGQHVLAINPTNLLDVTKSAEAYGKVLRFRDPDTFGRTETEWAEYRMRQEWSREEKGLS